jgi:hypothetical protein
LAPVPNKNPRKSISNTTFSGVHILAADSVSTRIHHEESKLTPWEEV